LLSLATVLDGMSRAEAARIGGMERQTLRDWVHRFNAAGPDGLLDNWASGPAPRLSAAQKAELAKIVEIGPDREAGGAVYSITCGHIHRSKAHKQKDRLAAVSPKLNRVF
jgi:putative transposase